MAREYCEWHCHGEYSILDGTGPAKQYAARAAELGYTHLNKTDHGTMAGTLDHIRECKKVGIMPVAGAEVYFKPNRHLQDTSWQNDPTHFKREFHLTVSAMSMKGWQNLIKLTSYAWLEGYYNRPCIDYELLENFGEDIVVTSACIASYLSQALLNGDEKSAKYFTDRIRKAVNNRFYIEIMPHDWDDQRQLNVLLVNFALKEGIPILATNDVHYATKDYAGTQKVLMMCSTGMTNLRKKAKHDAGEQVYGDGEIKSLYLKTGDEIYEDFTKYHPELPESIIEEAIKNSVDITKAFKPYIINKDYKVPKAIPDDEEAKKALKEWAYKGLDDLIQKWENKGQTQEEIDSKIVEYEERLNYELEVFNKLNVYHYMVLVADIVRWAKSNDGITPGTTKRPIRIGHGRGSAAGSLVSYLIGITNADPIAHGLLFERFINPDRYGMPDIDIDFDSDRREEVKEYTIARYGQENVATVSTKATFATRAVIKDISRIYDDLIPYSEAEALVAEVDKNVKTLKGLEDSVEIARDFARKYPEPWDHMKRLEDQISRDGKHASAIVVTDKPLLDVGMALETRKAAKGQKDRMVVTAFTDAIDYPIIAEHGYLKMDYLATEAVTKIDLAAQKIGFEPNDMGCLIDPEDYEEDVIKKVFAEGNTLGIFQFSSEGLTKYLKQLKPDSLEHLVATNALYRPGPIAFLGQYNKRRHGNESWESWDVRTDEIMDPTFGIMLYQEQIMEIAKKLGNFTGGQADSLRKAVGKLYKLGKDEAKAAMNEFKEQWDKGTKENNIDPELAEKIWGYILDFSGYGFNKSHSLCYALQAYQEAWIKYYYPEVFYEILLTREPELTAMAIQEAKNFGVNITPPDVNRSDIGFVYNLDSKSLVYGLTAIRDLGPSVAEPIVSERRANGPYRSLDDLLDRLPSVNAGSVKSLIWAGGFNNIGNQIDMLSDYRNQDKVVATLKDGKKKNIKTQSSLYTIEELLDKQTWAYLVDPDEIESIEHIKSTYSYVDLYKANQKLATPKPFIKVNSPTPTDLYDGERHVLGLNILHKNPVYDDGIEYILDRYISSSDEILSTPSSKDLHFSQRAQSECQLAGEVLNFNEWKVKSGNNKGRHMAKFTLRYYDKSYEIVVFAKDFEQLEFVPKNGDAVIMITNKMGEDEFSAKAIWQLNDFLQKVNSDETQNVGARY